MPFTSIRPLIIDVVTTAGRVIPLELRILPKTLEVWRDSTRWAVFRRAHIAAWLRDPQSRLTVNAVTFSTDHNIDRTGRPAISMPDVTAWALFADDAAALRQRLQPSRQGTAC